MNKEKQYYFDKKENISFLLRIFYGLCGLLVLIELFYHRHIIHAWEKLFAFYPLYGFIACVLLVLIAAKARKVLMRKEDYYDD